MTYVVDNNLSPLSMMRMREARWDSLTILALGIFYYIQEGIKSAAGDAKTFRWWTSLK